MTSDRQMIDSADFRLGVRGEDRRQAADDTFQSAVAFKRHAWHRWVTVNICARPYAACFLPVPITFHEDSSRRSQIQSKSMSPVVGQLPWNSRYAVGQTPNEIPVVNQHPFRFHSSSWGPANYPPKFDDCRDRSTFCRKRS